MRVPLAVPRWKLMGFPATRERSSADAFRPQPMRLAVFVAVANRLLPIPRPVLTLALALLLPAWALPLPAQSLPGLTVTGSTFTYDASDGQVTGILRIPSGPGPFPAVLISHGKGGTATNFSQQHATTLLSWGFVCIGPNYTHAGAGRWRRRR